MYENLVITWFLMNYLCVDLQIGAQADVERCYSGKYTTTGECCHQCPPGEGVTKACGATQTVCSPCLDSE